MSKVLEFGISVLDNGFMVSYYETDVYKIKREAFLTQNDLLGRLKELLNKNEENSEGKSLE